MNASDERPQRKGPRKMTEEECRARIDWLRSEIRKAIRTNVSHENWVDGLNADVVRLKKRLAELKGEGA